ncbi:MAG: GNAT family N-acetyltransferase [Candidatus Falkowbacteria bacterium]
MQKNTCTYRKINNLDNAAEAEKLARCYQEVFAGYPWNEYKKCPDCGVRWGKEDAPEDGRCSKCDATPVLVDFWAKEDVINDFQKQLQSSSGVLCVAVNSRDEITGFCSGYETTPEELEKHLQLPELAKWLRCYFPNGVRFGYQDEIGVLDSYRGQKIATELFKKRMEDFKASGLDIAVLRTKTMPPTITFKWYPRLGYSVIQCYHDDDCRVIMATEIKSIQL